ncbi:hypothetical protein [Rhodococcus jostii]|nr:hypothetical protein [Rhodococcus jostii]
MTMQRPNRSDRRRRWRVFDLVELNDVEGKKKIAVDLEEIGGDVVRD